MRKAQRKAGIAPVKTPVPTGENRDSCDMHRCSSRAEVHEGLPGSFFIDRSQYPVILWHKLPEGSVGFVRLRPLPADEEPHPSWDWDGNEDAPTLKPSVHYVWRWHGWFRAGRMVSC